MSTSTTSAGSSCSAPATTSRAQRSRVRKGRTAASSRTGRSAVAVSTGTPAPRSTRRSVAVRAPPRTTTAIRDHGTPSSRWADAQPPGDVARLLRRGAQQVRLDGRPRAAAGRPRGARPLPPPRRGRPPAPRRRAPPHRTGATSRAAAWGASGHDGDDGPRLAAVASIPSVSLTASIALPAPIAKLPT